MKCSATWSWLVALGLLVGCQGETATEDTGSAEPPTVTVPGESGEDTTSGEDVDASTDDMDGDDLSGAAESSDVSDASDTPPELPDVLELGGEPEEPAERSLDDLANEMMAAAQGGDFTKAIELADLALEKYPDNFEMQLNRMMLQLRVANAMESEDKAQAAEQLIKVGEFARPLVDKLQEQPEGPQRDQLERIVAMGIFQESRGLAYQGKVDETVSTLEAAMQSGMTSFGQIEEDAMFATVRDSEQFQQAVQELERKALEAEFAATSPFEFDFTLPNLEAQDVKLSDYAGKYVIVDVWGTWCPPCRMEIPHFIKLQETYADDLAIVGITYEQADGEEAVEQVRSFAEEQGINYDLVLGDQDTADKIPDFGSFPTTLFLDRDGNVRLKIVGLHPYEKLESYLKYLMDEETANNPSAEAAST